jgi:hypothetical protein
MIRLANRRAAVAILVFFSASCEAKVWLTIREAKDSVTSRTLAFISADSEPGGPALEPGEAIAVEEQCAEVKKFVDAASGITSQQLGPYAVRVMPPESRDDPKQRFYVETNSWKKCFRASLQGPWNAPARDHLIEATLNVFETGQNLLSGHVRLLVRGESPSLEINLADGDECKQPYPVRVSSPESCNAIFWDHSVPIKIDPPSADSSDFQVSTEPADPRSDPYGRPVPFAFRARSSITAAFGDLFIARDGGHKITIKVPYEIEEVGRQTAIPVSLKVNFEAPQWFLGLSVAIGVVIMFFVREQTIDKGPKPKLLAQMLLLGALILFGLVAWYFALVSKAKVGLLGYELNASILPGAFLGGCLVGFAGTPGVRIAGVWLENRLDKLG